MPNYSISDVFSSYGLSPIDKAGRILNWGPETFEDIAKNAGLLVWCYETNEDAEKGFKTMRTVWFKEIDEYRQRVLSKQA